jgi:NAD(P)-dependent dehydrogenase (short-subunit alcohol dehydrogenase family)
MQENQFGKNGWTPYRIENLAGKSYLITGATSGTGFEATKILLSKGARVLMLNRNPIKSTKIISALKQELGNAIDVSSIEMDLASQASVKKAAEEVLSTVSQIHALICNAAIA